LLREPGLDHEPAFMALRVDLAVIVDLALRHPKLTLAYFTEDGSVSLFEALRPIKLNRFFVFTHCPMYTG